MPQQWREPSWPVGVPGFRSLVNRRHLQVDPARRLRSWTRVEPPIFEWINQKLGVPRTPRTPTAITAPDNASPRTEVPFRKFTCFCKKYRIAHIGMYCICNPHMCKKSKVVYLEIHILLYLPGATTCEVFIPRVPTVKINLNIICRDMSSIIMMQRSIWKKACYLV